MPRLNLRATLGIVFILIIVVYKFIFSLGFNKRDDSWPKKCSTKKKTNFVICHPVSSSSGLRPSAFRPSPIFRRLLFMCFSATASRQRCELPIRRWASPSPPFPFSSPLRPFCHTKLLRVTRREVACARIKCQIFWKCKQVESPSVPVSGHGSPIFSPFFCESKVPRS